jgi:hypothetical protein
VATLSSPRLRTAAEPAKLLMARVFTKDRLDIVSNIGVSPDPGNLDRPMIG